MRKLRYAVLTLALMLPLGMLAQDGSAGGEQQASGPRGRHIPNVDQQLTRLSKKLKLTDEQKPQVKTILQEQHDQMQQLWQNSSGSRAGVRDKMREIHADASGKIRALLTDDQKAKFDKLEARRQQQMEKHRRGENPAAGQSGQSSQ